MESRRQGDAIGKGYKLGAGKQAMRRGVAIAEPRANAFKTFSGALEGVQYGFAAKDAYENVTECESHPVTKNWRKTNRVAHVLFALGVLGFFLWRIYAPTSWTDFFMQTYLLTGGLFGVLLLSDYPPFGSWWFWKTMLPISGIHLVVLGTLLEITIETAPLKLQLPTRMIYGAVGVVAVLEWWISLRIIAFFSPKTEY